MRPAFITHPRCVDHDLPGHPEHAGRLRAVWRCFEHSGLLPRLHVLEAQPCDDAHITAVHSAAYLSALDRIAGQERTQHLDADTYVNPESPQIARLAAGAAVMAVAGILQGDFPSAVVAARPPGHHAIASRGMGFCLLNNIAIAAEYAVRVHGLRRVMIVDYDVHHGNGTEAIFYQRPDVLFVSTHQFPLYPMTGHISDRGAGAGIGATLNLPMPAGCGDQRYREVFEQVIVPAAQRFQPQLMLVSAGYDAHWADPLAGMQLTLRGFHALSVMLRDLAQALCGGRIAFIMEGGYHVEALGHGMVNLARLLLGEPCADPLGPPERSTPEPDVSPLIAQVLAGAGPWGASFTEPAGD
jgi:acetoin utilization deacetylase AcuC-like enzyme